MDAPRLCLQCLIPFVFLLLRCVVCLNCVKDFLLFPCPLWGKLSSFDCLISSLRWLVIQLICVLVITNQPTMVLRSCGPMILLVSLAPVLWGLFAVEVYYLSPVALVIWCKFMGRYSEILYEFMSILRDLCAISYSRFVILNPKFWDCSVGPWIISVRSCISVCEYVWGLFVASVW